ncbi:MAG: restriction endonuclease subunit S [Verrucomicrobiales bacterium]|nr:restriction endonuclease subunit S [Verrucomicrobiales bacterium]
MSDGLPQGWVSVPLSETIEDVQPGFASGRKDVEGGITHLRMNNIGLEGELVLDLLRTVPPELAKPRHELQAGDVLVCTTNSGKLVGKCAYFDLPGRYAFSNHLTRLRPNPQVVDGRFLRWSLWLDWKRGVFDDKCKHWVNQSTLPKDALLKNDVVLPPLAEQRRIVAKLETLLGKVDACQQRLAKIPVLLKRFRQSVLAAACSGRLTADWREENGEIEPATNLLSRIRKRRPAKKELAPDEVEPIPTDELPEGWSWILLWEVLKAQNGRSFPSKDYTATGVRLLRPGNLHVSGKLEWNEKNTASLPNHWAEDYPDFVLESGDLLMNLTAQSLKDEFLGRVCLKTDKLAALLNQRICRFKMWTDDDLRPFFFRYFKSPRFRSYVNTLDTGSLIRHMHTKQVLGHVAPLPPLPEQHEIVRRVEALFAVADRIEARFQKAQAQVSKLTPALLAKAFRGELVPQDPDDEPAAELLARIREARPSTPSSRPSRRGSPEPR